MSETWFVEKHTPYAGLTLAVKARLYDARSLFQRIEVLDTHEYGRTLLLDGCVMLTDRDEFIYHEMIVHPALLCHPNPERVAIVGGGDGGSVREALKHPQVQSVHLVEIDPMVTEVSRKFFPALSSALDDPRVEVHVADGFSYLETRPNTYDVILVDSIDPKGEAAKLFSPSFFERAKGALRRGGILVQQTESPFYDTWVMLQVVSGQKALFRNVAAFLAFIPTYPSGLWSFSFASDVVNPRTAQLRTDLPFLSSLKYFTPEIFRAAFTLPAYLLEGLRQPASR